MGDRRKCQTYTASPAEPGGLPVMLGEMPKGALPFDLLAFATTIGERYSMTQNEIIRLVMKEAEALGDNYCIGSSPR